MVLTPNDCLMNAPHVTWRAAAAAPKSAWGVLSPGLADRIRGHAAGAAQRQHPEPGSLWLHPPETLERFRNLREVAVQLVADDRRLCMPTLFVTVRSLTLDAGPHKPPTWCPVFMS